MSQEKDQIRLFLLMAMLALWLVAWGYSLVFLALTQPTGDGFTRGMNRITGFLGWQGVAGMLAIAVWGVGRGFPKGSGVRKVSIFPLGMVLVLLLAIAGLVLWGRFAVP